MIRPPQPITTARLILRKPIEADADEIFARYAADPEVTRYLTWRPNNSVEETLEFLRGSIAAWGDLSGRFPYVITLAGTGELVGMIEIRLANFKAEIGYVLARRYWGHGYMTEAAGAVAKAALGMPGVFRVWAVCDVENLASARVMEKIGMSREGVLRRFVMHPNLGPQPRDVYCYSVTR